MAITPALPEPLSSAPGADGFRSVGVVDAVEMAGDEGADRTAAGTRSGASTLLDVPPVMGNSWMVAAISQRFKPLAAHPGGLAIEIAGR